MAQFQVEVCETRTKIISVEASDSVSALESVKNLYEYGEISMSGDDVNEDYEINIL